MTVPTGSQFSNKVSKSSLLCHRRWWAYRFHQLLDEEVPVRTYRDCLQRWWCRCRQQLLNHVYDGLRFRRYGQCRINFCHLTNHTHRVPVRACLWLNFHFTVSFPYPTTVNYVGNGSIWSQTVQMSAKYTLRLSIDETVSHHLRLNLKVNIHRRPPS